MFKHVGIRLTQTLFAAAVLTCNVRFALYIGTDPVSTAIWVALAVGSAIWTMLAIDVAVTQWRAGYQWRASACVGLLCMALTYDAMAAYGLARIEQKSLIAAQDARTLKIEAFDQQIENLKSQIAISKAPPLELAQARLKSLPPVPATQCAYVAGPNSMSRAAANRVREACATQAKASADVAAATARDRLQIELAATQAAKSGLVGSGEVRDARTEALPPVLAAMLPVILMTVFAMFGSFAVDRPAQPPQPQTHVARSGDGGTPEQPPQPQIETGEPDGTVRPHLIAIAQRDATELHPLKKDTQGWVRGSQRTLAKLIGTNPSAINSTLKEMRDAGEIELTTAGGTAYRVARARAGNFAN